jgi:probable phosphoglycerate mutase
LRVRESAEVFGTALGLPAVAVHDLRGQDFGTADGRSWLEVTTAFGGPPSRDPERPIAPGAEPWNRYAARVLAALTRLLELHAGGRLLVVAHGRTVALAGALLAGEPDPAAAAVAAPTAGAYAADHGGLAHWRLAVPLGDPALTSA